MGHRRHTTKSARTIATLLLCCALLVLGGCATKRSPASEKWSEANSAWANGLNADAVQLATEGLALLPKNSSRKHHIPRFLYETRARANLALGEHGHVLNDVAAAIATLPDEAEQSAYQRLDRRELNLISTSANVGMGNYEAALSYLTSEIESSVITESKLLVKNDMESRQEMLIRRADIYSTLGDTRLAVDDCIAAIRTVVPHYDAISEQYFGGGSYSVYAEIGEESFTLPDGLSPRSLDDNPGFDAIVSVLRKNPGSEPSISALSDTDLISRKAIDREAATKIIVSQYKDGSFSNFDTKVLAIQALGIFGSKEAQVFLLHESQFGPKELGPYLAKSLESLTLD